MKPAFLLDTMVVSESFKKAPDAAVTKWIGDQQPSSLAISVVTYGEIAAGVEKQRHNDASAFLRLETWLRATQLEFADRSLPITASVAMQWGVMSMRLRRKDMDIFIAATALQHDLTLVTRNVRHFEPTGVRLFNPYS